LSYERGLKQYTAVRALTVRALRRPRTATAVIERLIF